MPSASPKSDEMIDIHQLWRNLWLHKWKILLFTSSVTAAAAFAVSRMQPVYRATATLLIENEQPKVLAIEDVYRLQAPNESYILTQTEVLKSRELARRVMERLQIADHPLFDPRQQQPDPGLRGLIKSNLPLNLLPEDRLPSALQEQEPVVLTPSQAFEAATDKFTGGLSVSPVKKTQLVKISYELEDPAMAATISNAVAEVYISQYLQNRSNASVQASDWLNQRLIELRENLDLSEARLQAYREEEQLIDVRGVQTIDAEQLSQLSQRHTQAKLTLEEKRTAYQQLQNLGPSPAIDGLLSLPSVLSDPLVQRLRESLSVADGRVAELAKRYGHKHPRMIAATSEAQSLADALRQQVDTVAEAIANEYFAANSTEKAVTAQLDITKERLKDVNRKEFKLAEIEREIATNRDLYNIFLTRAQETQGSGNIPAPHARIMDPAVTPRYPAKPNKKMIVMMSALGSGMLAFMVALIASAVRRDPPEVILAQKPLQIFQPKLDVQLLGFLPHIKSNRADTPFRGPSSDGPGAFAEAIRTTRTGLYLSNPDRRPTCTVITSSTPKEGKSTVALNLALALSKMDRTLLIDADTLRSSLTYSLGFSPALPGLYNLVSGSEEYRQCIHMLDDSDLDFLPVGFVKRNSAAGGYLRSDPSELLSTQAFSETLRHLKNVYSHLIVDASSIAEPGNALLQSPMADSVVFVVDTTTTGAAEAASGLDDLKRGGAPVRGVILNKVDMEKMHRFDEHYQDFYHGYAGLSAEEPLRSAS